jgi:serine/threonine protein kinase
VAPRATAAIPPPENIISHPNPALITTERPPPPPTSGGPFEWPTNANHYRLINRVGQGAFASVWRARIVDSSTESEDDEGVQCAIKIMDLEHVNINISGESIFMTLTVFGCEKTRVFVMCWLSGG